MTAIVSIARSGLLKSLFIGLVFTLLQTSAGAQDVGFGDATYNPATGRITIEVDYAQVWTIESPNGLLTGPDTELLKDVLPVYEGSLAEIVPTYVTHGTFGPPFSYGPLDLGRIAQTHIPVGELVLVCGCPFGAPFRISFVRYVPEPTPWSLALAMTLIATCFAPRTAFAGQSRRVSRSDIP